MSGCPSGKVRYRDRLGALLVLSVAGRRRHTRRAKDEARAYRCGLCGGGWHLTSAPTRRG